MCEGIGGAHRSLSDLKKEVWLKPRVAFHGGLRGFCWTFVREVWCGGVYSSVRDPTFVILPPAGFPPAMVSFISSKGRMQRAMVSILCINGKSSVASAVCAGMSEYADTDFCLRCVDEKPPPVFIVNASCQRCFGNLVSSHSVPAIVGKSRTNRPSAQRRRQGEQETRGRRDA